MSSVCASWCRAAFSCLPLLAVTLLNGGTWVGHCQGQDAAGTTAGELAKKYVDDFCVAHAAEAEAELWKKVTEGLKEDALNREQFGKGQRLDAATVEDLTTLVSENVKGFASQVEAIQILLTGEPFGTLRDEWTEIRKQRNRQDLLKAELLTSQPASMWVALVGRDVRWFWLWGFVALGALAAVSAHYCRHESRRALFGAKARAYGLTRLLKFFVGLSAIATGLAFFGAEPLMRFLTQPTLGVDVRSQAGMLEEVRKLAERRQAAEALLQTTLAECQDKWKRWLQGEQNDKLREHWRRGYVATVKSTVATALRQTLVAEMKSDKLALAELDKTVRENRRAVEQLERWKWGVSSTVGATIAGTTLGLAFLLLASIQRRDHIIKHTCPVCLARNTLERDAEEPDEDIGNAPPMVRCNNDIRGVGPCDFTFPAEYQERVKVCFPTLGVPSAGKTHWMTMVYRELKAGRYKKDVWFQKVDCRGSEDFDVLLAKLLQQRQTKATQQDRLPQPLIFDFQDADAWGKSKILVNVFDYSGEVTKGTLSKLQNATQRRRALKADGYLFFLDQFQTDVQRVHHGRSIRAPVALCLTKLDLLSGRVQQPGFLDKFHEQLKDIDPTAQEVSDTVIEARSVLTENLCRVLWPGWPIGNIVNRLFGGRCRFFPMTPVGLDNPGSSSPGAHGRIMDPFGIVEPLIWLLHMNGYPILTEKNEHQKEG
jgi:hypothetical protein